MTPRLVESSLLVVEPFTDSRGDEWRPGDRAPLTRRSVRIAAMTNPERFRMEFETQPVDMDWLREVDEGYERQYADYKRHRDGAEERRQKALREELKAQQSYRDPKDLERRYKLQEAERKKREADAREERERSKIEYEIEYGLSGFHG